MKKLAKKQEEKEERLKIRKEKLKLRKMKKKNKKEDDFSRVKQDKVEFGEVANEPPLLTAKPRKSSNLEKVTELFL